MRPLINTRKIEKTYENIAKVIKTKVIYSIESFTLHKMSNGPVINEIKFQV